MTESIHPQMTVGRVHLAVADLEGAIAFYETHIGLRLLRRQAEVAYLGAGDTALLSLAAQPGARRVRGVTGLYHFALLLPDRAHLARTLLHLAESQTPLQGFADHLVSEAIYLADPEGNGIEIYRDRPRAEWPRDNGQLRMATDPLDVESLLREGRAQDRPWRGLPAGTAMGHIHLHVGHLDPAEAFYHQVLGLDLMLRYGPAASFLSAGGYHHHVGLNTWAGVGAPPPLPDAVGLRYFELRLPDPAALAPVIERVRAAGVDASEQDGGYLVRDPAHNAILLRA